jgi:O-antigen/teichoic acid export membrane protein
MTVGRIEPNPESSLAAVMARGAAGTLAVRVGGSALAFVTALALGRLLGPDGYGAYSFAVACATALATPALLGLDTYTLRQSAVWARRADWASLRGLLRRAAAAVGAASVLLGLAAGLVAELVSPGSQLTERLQQALPLLPLTALALLGSGALQGLQRVTAAIASSTLSARAAVLAGVGVAYAIAGDDVSSQAAVGIQLVAGAIALALTTLVLARAIPLAATAGRLPEPPPGWLRTSIPMGLSAGFTAILWQLPLVAAGAFGSAADAGLYAAAAQACVPFLVLSAAATAPFAPLVARLWAEGDRARLQRGVTRTTRYLGGITAAGAVAAVLLAEPLLSLFGEGFDEAADTYRIVVAALLVNALATFNGLLLTLTGHERQAALASGLTLAVGVAMAPLLVPPLGAEGAALAFLASTLLRNIANTIQSWRLLGMDTTVLGLR